MFKSETYFHKWGKVQGMEPNGFQMHSHFGSCTCVGVVDVQIFGLKSKQTPNWASMTSLEIF